MTRAQRPPSLESCWCGVRDDFCAIRVHVGAQRGAPTLALTDVAVLQAVPRGEQRDAGVDVLRVNAATVYSTLECLQRGLAGRAAQDAGCDSMEARGVLPSRLAEE